MSSVFRPKLADKTNAFQPGKEVAYFLQISDLYIPYRPLYTLENSLHISIKITKTVIWIMTVGYYHKIYNK